jgi:hypothetical protein
MVSIGAALVLAACGSSSSDSSGNGGGGGGGGSTLPTGTLGGVAFTPVDGLAFSFAPTSCTVQGFNVGMTALGLAFTSVAGSCSVFQAVGACNDKANATLVSAIFSKVSTSGTASAIVPGTYALTTGQPLPDASGNMAVTSMNYTKTNATCVNAAASVTATSGSLTIATITTTRVTGSLNVAFSDGSTFGGNFDVALCSAPFNVCDMQSCGNSGTCIP